MEALEEGGRSVRDIEHGGDTKVPEMEPASPLEFVHAK
jgi:hypothetical protein